MPLLARIPTGIAAEMREAAHQRRAVELLELVELASHRRDARSPRARRRACAGSRARRRRAPRRVVARLACGAAAVRRLRAPSAARRCGARWRARACRSRRSGRRRRTPAVHVRAAERLGVDVLAGRRLHERRAAEEHPALVADDDVLVRHRRHIGAARGAGAVHHRDLRDARAPRASPGCRRCARSGRGPGKTSSCAGRNAPPLSTR